MITINSIKKMKISKIVTMVCALSIASAASAIDVKWTSSTDAARWHDGGQVEVSAFDPDVVYDLMITRYKQHYILGWGGCFGELGWDALQLLSKNDRDEAMRLLFAPDGAAFSYCRTPIGANDFARKWYSYDETPGDYQLKHFSTKNDKSSLIPYIKSALKVNPDLKLWGSPWSPPTWMKSNKNYATKADKLNGMDPKLEVKTGAEDMVYQDARTLDTYARYLSNYLTEYKKAGINIGMIMFQNEPYTHNIWPNCSWSPKGTANFVGKYLGPRLAREHKDVEIWHGTMNTSNYDDLMAVMTDPEASKYLSGMGFQWEGKDVIARMRATFRDMPMMCTENECGSGTFDWPAAEHTWQGIKKYVEDGCGVYMYFNMVLKDKGTSSWGWDQNTLIRVDSKTRTYTLTPEYFLMKHFGRFVTPGSYKLKLMGKDGDTLAFVRPDGTVVLFVANCDDNSRTKTVAWNGNVLTLKLEAHSFNTFEISK